MERISQDSAYRSVEEILVSPQERYKHVNAVLIRPEVGKVRTSIHKLPGEEHVYGKRFARDSAGGAKQAVSEWKLPEFSRAHHMPVDFQRVNRLTVQQGLYRPKQIAEFRRFNDIRVPHLATKILQTHGILEIDLPDVSFAYGRKNRAPTPMDLVMKQQYQIEGDRQRLTNYHEKLNAERERRQRQRRLHGSHLSHERVHTHRDQQNSISKDEIMEHYANQLRPNTLSMHDHVQGTSEQKTENSVHIPKHQAPANNVKQFKMQRFMQIPAKISFREGNAGAAPNAVVKLMQHLQQKQSVHQHSQHLDNSQGMVVQTLPDHMDF